MIHHNTSQLATMRSKKGSKMNTIDRDNSLGKNELNSMFQIFSTVDDSPYVVSVPPTATSQVGFNSRYTRSNLMTAEDLACFNTDNQNCQLYNFDRVINDCYSRGNTIQKLYSKIVKHRLQEQWPAKSACVLMFGPSDMNKTRKES